MPRRKNVPRRVCKLYRGGSCGGRATVSAASGKECAAAGGEEGGAAGGQEGVAAGGAVGGEQGGASGGEQGGVSGGAACGAEVGAAGGAAGRAAGGAAGGIEGGAAGQEEGRAAGGAAGGIEGGTAGRAAGGAAGGIEGGATGGAAGGATEGRAGATFAPPHRVGPLGAIPRRVVKQGGGGVEGGGGAESRGGAAVARRYRRGGPPITTPDPHTTKPTVLHLNAIEQTIANLESKVIPLSKDAQHEIFLNRSKLINSKYLKEKDFETLKDEVLFYVQTSPVFINGLSRNTLLNVIAGKKWRKPEEQEFYSCAFCELSFKEEELLSCHIFTHSKAHEIKEFGKLEGSREFFGANFIDLHGEKQSITCPAKYCTRIYDSMKTLMNHVTRKHSLKNRNSKDTIENEIRTEKYPPLSKQERKRRNDFIAETMKLRKEHLSEVIHRVSQLCPECLIEDHRGETTVYQVCREAIPQQTFNTLLKWFIEQNEEWIKENIIEWKSKPIILPRIRPLINLSKETLENLKKLEKSENNQIMNILAFKENKTNKLKFYQYPLNEEKVVIEANRGKLTLICYGDQYWAEEQTKLWRTQNTILVEYVSPFLLIKEDREQKSLSFGKKKMIFNVRALFSNLDHHAAKVEQKLNSGNFLIVEFDGLKMLKVVNQNIQKCFICQKNKKLVKLWKCKNCSKFVCSQKCLAVKHENCTSCGISALKEEIFRAKECVLCGQKPMVGELFRCRKCTTIFCSPNCRILYETCHACGATKDETKLHRCSKCKLVYYCSQACNVAKWSSHKKMCHDHDYHCALCNPD